MEMVINKNKIELMQVPKLLSTNDYLSSSEKSSKSKLSLSNNVRTLFVRAVF